MPREMTLHDVYLKKCRQRCRRRPRFTVECEEGKQSLDTGTTCHAPTVLFMLWFVPFSKARLYLGGGFFWCEFAAQYLAVYTPQLVFH